MKVWNTKSGYTISLILGGRSNVFMLKAAGKNILVDTSPGYRWKKLKQRLYSLNIEKIDFLILTHSHFDHAANGAKIKSDFGARVIVNNLEAVFLVKGENTNLHGTNSLTHLLVDKLAPFILERLKYEPCYPDITTDQKYDLRDLGINGYILHTPGHSPGSQSIIIDNEIALVGDAMFGVFPRSVFPPFAADERELIISWGKLLDTGCSVFLPSHGTQNSKKSVQKEFKKKSMRPLRKHLW